MENSSKVMAVQKGMALLPFMPQILSQNCKNFPNIMYAVYLKAMKKIEQRIFEIKSIPTEYFEELIMRNTYSTDTKGDLKSYALLSVNSLLALSATNESWIEIEGCGNLEKTESKEDYWSAMDAGNFQTYQPTENPYLIQCYAVSSIEKGFVIYVTNEKYFNITQHFNMRVTMGPVYKVKVKKSDLEIHPEVAKTLVLGLIEPAAEVELNDVELIIEKFFKTSKYLKIDEVFQVNLRKLLPCYGLNYFNIESISFKVLNILGKSNANVIFTTSGNVGFYVSDKDTNISLATKTQSFTPVIYTKYIPIKRRLGYEISMCPAGLEKYYSKLEELFETLLDGGKLKFRPMILVTGVKGSGKKTVINCLAKRFGLKLFSVDCFDFVALDGSTVEVKISSLLQKSQKLSPVIILMENIELLGRDEHCYENVFAIEVFKNQIDKLYKDHLRFPVIIVASSNQKNIDIVPSIQRMFIQTISFELLKKEEIFALLKWLVNEVGMTCFPEVLEKVADRVTGYLFADLTKLIRLALKFQRLDDNLPEEHMLLITEDHWEKGIQIMEALYSDSIGTAKVPSVHWEDVGGLDHVKEEITLALEFPTKYPELMDSGLRVSGFLFFGPPGTGKTLMAKAVATEFNYNFLSVKGPELMNMYVGQSEKNVREVFRRAREAAPCVIFFDELDSLAPNRGRSSGVVTDRIVSQLLAEMDGLESNKGIFVIGATNRPDLVDPALLRPGRFDKMFYVGVCESTESKLSVLKALTRRFSLAGDVDLETIVRHLPAHVTGADIYSICSNAWLEAARKCIRDVSRGEKSKLPVVVNLDDFQLALSYFVPSLTPDIIKNYEKYRCTDQ